MQQGAPTHGPVIIIHSRLPGLGMSLTLPASDDPGHGEGQGTCRKECWVVLRIGIKKGIGRGCCIGDVKGHGAEDQD